jgi:hypothetical protein
MAYTTIDDPSAYFTTLLYTGNATDDRNLTNDANAGDFKPDFIWLKERSSTSSHQLINSTRGSQFALMADSNAIEDEDANRVQAFQTNGFQVGTASTVNQDTITMVAWQWKANGGTTTTNDASSTSIGTVDSVIQANTDAGFSIVTFTGGSNTFSMAHGLGAVPEMIWSKRRDTDTGNWHVYHKATGKLGATFLNTTGAFADAPYFGDTDPTSTVFSQSNSAIENGEGAVAYCFRSIQGYSNIGSYTGNGNANGTFVYTGFKPAWVLYKKSSAAENWHILDNKRDTLNPNSFAIDANNVNAEANDANLQMDFLSNGFKLRTSHGTANGSGETYIYYAIAEHPFVSSKGVPTTAR